MALPGRLSGAHFGFVGRPGSGRRRRRLWFAAALGGCVVGGFTLAVAAADKQSPVAARASASRPASPPPPRHQTHVRSEPGTSVRVLSKAEAAQMRRLLE